MSKDDKVVKLRRKARGFLSAGMVNNEMESLFFEDDEEFEPANYFFGGLEDGDYKVLKLFLLSSLALDAENRTEALERIADSLQDLVDQK